MTRPNFSRRKATIYLGPEDRRRMALIRKVFRVKTNAEAIRLALRHAEQLAEKTLPPPATKRIRSKKKVS